MKRRGQSSTPGARSRSTGQPLCRAIRKLVLPKRVKLSKQEYDGTTNPYDHMAKLEEHFSMQGIDEDMMCRIFPSTLIGAARDWYSTLSRGSITSFRKLRKRFLTKFGCTQPAPKTTASLTSWKRRESEKSHSVVCPNS